jgi:hypothetical protein
MLQLKQNETKTHDEQQASKWQLSTDVPEIDAQQWGGRIHERLKRRKLGDEFGSAERQHFRIVLLYVYVYIYISEL